MAVEIPVSGHINARDFRAIQGLYIRNGKRVIAAGASLFLVYGAVWGTLGFWLSTGIPAGVVMIFFIPFYRWSIARTWKKNPLLHQHVDGVVRDDAITWVVKDLSTTRLPWNMFTKYRQSDSITLLYVGANQAYYFPRHYFATGEAWAEFRALISTKLGR